MTAAQVSIQRTPPLPAWIRLVREPSLAPKRGSGTRIRSAEDVFRLVRPFFDREEVEVMICLMLDSQSRVVGQYEVSRGLLNSCLVHPREVFRAAIGFAAAGIILAHNHPSGDPTPSPEDRAVTRQLAAAGKLLDIPVYDHVIVGAERFTSLALDCFNPFPLPTPEAPQCQPATA